MLLVCCEYRSMGTFGDKWTWTLTCGHEQNETYPLERLIINRSLENISSSEHFDIGEIWSGENLVRLLLI